jgi:hypothetical protein
VELRGRHNPGVVQGTVRVEIRAAWDHGDRIGQAVSRTTAGRRSRRSSGPYKLRFGGLTPRSFIFQTLEARACEAKGCLVRW